MKKYSYSLDAFRVLAILCVFVCHLNVFNEGLEGGKIFLGGNIPSIGGLAVHYFILFCYRHSWVHISMIKVSHMDTWHM